MSREVIVYEHQIIGQNLIALKEKLRYKILKQGQFQEKRKK